MTAAALRELAGQLLVVGFPGHVAPPSLLARVAGREVGGVILFARNIAAPRQVAELTRSLRAAAPSGAPPLLISVDQEGGRVQRLRAPLALWPPARALGVRGDPQLTRRVGRAIGDDLAALGFNLDFAPVLDVVESDENSVIGDRAFGATAEIVSTHALAFARGLFEAGVLPCGKHFPGHGGPVADSHVTLPVERRPAAVLAALDLRPFVAAVTAGLPLLMSAHVVYLAHDDARPGTLSLAINTALLRGQLGYAGALISDDLEMGAIAGTRGAGEAALAALRAGVDLLLFCHEEERQRAALEAVVAAAQADVADRARLEEAAARARQLRRTLPTPRDVDPAAAPTLVDAAVHAALLRELVERA